mgnify:CR=1 FL=1
MDEHSKDISEEEAFAKKYCNPEDSDIISDLDLHARKTAWALLQRIKHLEKKSCVCEECGSEVEDENLEEEVKEEEAKEEEVKVEKTLALYPNMPTKMHIDHASKVDNAEQKSIRWMEKFGEWKHVNQVSNWQGNGSVEWEVDVKTPGLYYVLLNYKGNGRLVWNVSTSENEMIQNQQAATEKYATYPIGIIEFKKSGKKKFISAGASVSGVSWKITRTPSRTSSSPVNVMSVVGASNPGGPIGTPVPSPQST